NAAWSGMVTVLNPATSAVLIADDNLGHTGSSNPFNVLSSNFPPSIIVQPANQLALPGCDASFNIVASGTVPLSYQWFRQDGILTEQTNAVLSLSNLQAQDFTGYYVVVSNVAGTSNSSTATLGLDQQPVAGPDTLRRPFNGGVKVMT